MSPGDANLLPDCGGSIEELAIAMPGFLFETAGEPCLRTYGNFVGTLPASLVLLILVEKAWMRQAGAWLERIAPSCRARFVAVPEGWTMTSDDIWIQDSFLIGSHRGERRYIQIVSERSNNHAYWLRTKSSPLHTTHHIHLAGGNTLIGPDYRITGAGSIRHTMSLAYGGRTWEQALEIHRAFDGRPLSLFGYRKSDLDNGAGHRGTNDGFFQMPFHIDLVVSITGLRDVEGRPIVFVARTHASADPDGPVQSVFAERLDAGAERLRRRGFAVRRNKIPYIPPPQHLGGESAPAWGYLRAYNNVIVENESRSGENRPRVWIPHFSDIEPELERFDTHNRRAWESLGFRVNPVFGSSALLPHGGSIRCASKVLKRSGHV